MRLPIRAHLGNLTYHSRNLHRSILPMCGRIVESGQSYKEDDQVRTRGPRRSHVLNNCDIRCNETKPTISLLHRIPTVPW